MNQVGTPSISRPSWFRGSRVLHMVRQPQARLKIIGINQRRDILFARDVLEFY